METIEQKILNILNEITLDYAAGEAFDHLHIRDPVWWNSIFKEEKIHMYFFQFCKKTALKYPQLSILNSLFHVPNGERRDAATGSKLKKMGVMSGVSDFILPARSPLNGGILFLELKNIKEELSTEQEKFYDLVTSLGHNFRIARTPFDAASHVINHLYLN